MKYVSTRGAAGSANFEDVLLKGLVGDGGLFMPTSWPQLSANDLTAMRDQAYADVAATIMALFTGEAFSREKLLEMARDVYGAFDHGDVAPLTQVGEEDWILELYHGPTLAFKDFAMQILGRLFDDVLERRNQRITIVVATSGDTGAAAIEALKHCKRVNVVVLHPQGRVSEVQRRIMTCVESGQVTNIAVDGSFDDCQAIVKSLFADAVFVDEMQLSGVNSINWARLAAQMVYYFTATASVGGPVSFVVPTGNFGDVFAGYAAKRIGLPISKLVVATNSNDILHRAIQHGDYKPSGVAKTSSPSMDIQVASNFERLLFEVMDRDHEELIDRMSTFQREGAMTLSVAERDRIGETFQSYAASEDQTATEIKQHFDEQNALIDPHTAVARVAARRLRSKGALTGKVITLSTAHPAKFPDAVEQATGRYPSLPNRYSNLFERPEFLLNAKADARAIKSIMRERHGGDNNG